MFMLGTLGKRAVASIVVAVAVALVSGFHPQADTVDKQRSAD